jgi:hypothetical protein
MHGKYIKADYHVHKSPLLDLILCHINPIHNLTPFSQKPTTGSYLCGATSINPLNAELNPICHLLALLGAHSILHVSRIRVNSIKSHHIQP